MSALARVFNRSACALDDGALLGGGDGGDEGLLGRERGEGDFQAA